MSWTRAELKIRAKAAVKMYYWKMVLVALILSMIGGGASGVGSRSASDNSAGSGASSMFEGINMQVAMIAVIIVLVVVVIALALSVFVFNVLEVGCRGFFSRSMTEDPELGLIADGFTQNYWNCVKTQFLKSLFIGLWSLLFVIPGVIKAYEYRMVPYLLAEHPEMSSGEIFARSKEMMQGNKWDTFVLDISFVGWVLLSGITLGILYIFWVGPYIAATDAALYHRISGKDTYGNGGYGNYAGYDQNGYTQNGYDQNGYTQNGQAQNGYGQNGQAQNDYNRNSYGQNGQAQNDYNRNSYGQNGQTQNDYNENGYEQNSYTRNNQTQGGYDQNGYDQNGQNPTNGTSNSGYDQKYFSDN
ncbi:MAG: DUF975 family protein [Roseburia sp.]|nr:DUF975 family protein [Roseburia sp.]